MLPILTLLLAGCTAHQQIAEPGYDYAPPPRHERGEFGSSGFEVTGGPVDHVVSHASKALVHIKVYVAGSPEPLPGTAFVIRRDGVKAYLLTAYHVLHPAEGRVQVDKVSIRGGGVTPRESLQPQDLIIASQPEDDIALLHADAEPDGYALPVGRHEAELLGP